MLRNTIIYLLLTTLTFQCLGSLGVLTWFQINRNYIAAVMCENRGKPALHCDGQCVLMKKLKKLEQSEKSSRKADVNKTEINIILSRMIRVGAPTPILLAAALPPYVDRYSYLYMNPPFLPPQIA